MTNERMETLLLSVREVLRDEDTDAESRCRLAVNLIALLGPEEGDPGRAPEIAARDKPDPMTTNVIRADGGRRRRKKKQAKARANGHARESKVDAEIEVLRKIGGAATVSVLADHLGIDAKDQKGRKRLATRLNVAASVGKIVKGPNRGTYAIG